MRLPGIIKICKETGLGNKTIQQAFTLLKEDGYIAQEPYKGSYLISLEPKNAPPANERIGILLTEEQAETPYTLWLSHLLMDAALRKDLLGEVRIVPNRSDWNRLLEPGRLFSPRVTSVISLAPFRIIERFDAEQTVLPTVFFCHMTEDCAPLVALDTAWAYRELTLRAAQAGHTEILFMEDSQIGKNYISWHREGYQTAMNEAGLVQQETVFSTYDQAVMEPFLKTVVKKNRITAIISGSLQLTEEALLPAVHKLGISVPDQFSILTLGCTTLPWDEKQMSTGIELDFEYMAQLCFELLNRVIATGRCDQTCILTKGRFFEGQTFRAL